MRSKILEDAALNITGHQRQIEASLRHPNHRVSKNWWRKDSTVIQRVAYLHVGCMVVYTVSKGLFGERIEGVIVFGISYYLFSWVRIQIEGHRCIVAEVDRRNATNIRSNVEILKQLHDQFLDHWKALRFDATTHVQDDDNVDHSGAVWNIWNVNDRQMNLDRNCRDYSKQTMRWCCVGISSAERTRGDKTTTYFFRRGFLLCRSDSLYTCSYLIHRHISLLDTD